MAVQKKKLKNWEKTQRDILFKEDIQMDQRHENCSLLISEKCKSVP